MNRKNLRGEAMTIATDDSRDALLTDFGKATLKERYLLKGETFQGMFARVSAAYSNDSEMAQRIYDYMSQHWFMPSTPILSNGGTERGNPISCFLNDVEDNLQGIAKTWNENVWLAARGGGIGTYWGGVRSIGEKIGDVGETSGVIPFIKVQDSLTLGISQGSLRRGSAAVYLDMHHPEIEEFLDIRRPQGDVNRRSLNIHHGVMIDDKFMQAVLDEQDYDLISPKDGSVRATVSARSLWFKLLLSRLETGEPYMVFTDTVNRSRPEVYKALGLKVRQSNLCSEIALHTGKDHLGNDRTAVCCLASVNADTSDQWFGNEQFIRDVLMFLDNVLQSFIDRTEGVTGFERARYSAMRERSIGLGMMGFSSFLQRKSIPYEHTLAHYENRRLYGWMSKTAAIVNEKAAFELGACPDAIDAGLKLRWSHVFAVAPTASISIIAGTVSPANDPHPANVFTQKTLSGSFKVKNTVLEERLKWYADIHFDHFGDDAERSATAKSLFIEQAWLHIERNEGSVQALPFLTDHDKLVFKTWEELDQNWVITHAAARAPFIDQMASNNLFMPADVEKKILHDVHMSAWRKGVPSLYYLRSRSLQRATQATNVAGELPQPTAPREIVMVDRGAHGPVMEIDYRQEEECLVCQ